MKIAFAVVDNILGGGPVAHRVQMLAKGLVSLGHEVHILSPYKYQVGPLEDEIEGIKLQLGALIERNSANLFAAKLKKRFLMFQLCRKLLTKGIDWLILYDMGLDGLPLFLLAKKFGCRVAVDNCDIAYAHYYGSLIDMYVYFSQRLGNRFLAPYVNFNFVISTCIDQHLGTIAPSVPRVIVPAPVDIEKYQCREEARKNFRSQFGLQDYQVIGYFGSPHKVKGLEVLLKAAELLMKRGENFKLLVTGRTDRNLHLLNTIKKLRLEERVVLTGFIPDDSLIAAMSAADILVEPKIEHGANWAAFPQKLAEYLAMEKPIVASAIGDITQYLRHQENALLCQAGDPDSLAKALERLLHEPTLKENISLKARKTAEQFFDCKIIAKEMALALSKVSCVS